MDIVVENLTKKYGIQKAVDHISFSVKTGEILGFLGPNGAGKTTTLKAITTFLTPDEGNIKVGDYTVQKNADTIKKHIGYLPEKNPLYDDMPVIDYLRYVAQLYDLPKHTISDRINEMIHVCGLEREKHKKIGELSKGYQQRTGLAQALIHNPAVLILDEPTTGLDPNQIIEIRELIRKIGKEKTVILSSHILAEVEATCDRIIIINKGKIVADGTSSSLRQQAQGAEILKLTVEDANIDELVLSLKSIDSVRSVDFINKETHCLEVQSHPGQHSARKIFKLCVEKNWVITELTPTETKLEDVFRELTLN